MNAPYDANNPNAMFATILTRVDDLKDSHKELREEVKKGQEHLYERLREHDTELARLKTEDAVRGRQTKWAVAIVGAIAWTISTAIGWKH